jgi:protein deglycase
MPSPTVLVVIADGFEEIEAVTPVDVLRRAGAEVTVAAMNASLHVTGRSGITVHADTTLAAAMEARFDCVLLPGGPGVSLLRADARVLDLVRRQDGAKGWIAAICAAPAVLLEAGVIGGRRHTTHPSIMHEMPAALLDERTVVDGRLITSRGAGTALDFGLKVVEELFSSTKASEIAKSICA